MNIGDKVRLIHSKEEGIITRFLKDNVVEVEIEEGFRLPVMKRELAIVSRTEEKAFKTQIADNQVIAPKLNLPRADKGIYFAFTLLNERTANLHLINNTDWDLPFSLTIGTEKNHRGLAAGFLKARSTEKVPMELPMKDFDDWGTFSFSAFYYTLGFHAEKEPFVKKMRVRANSFFLHKKIAPILEKEAFVFQLDDDEIPLAINIEDLKEKMFAKNTEEIPPSKQFSATLPEQIDLHIEKLTHNIEGLNNAQMLEIQLKTFENSLEKAIASGMDNIVFIHGVGNGVLRNEIHRHLSKHKNVAFFEDAQKEKFGYGATKAKIK